jgi:hypothetical protein
MTMTARALSPSGFWPRCAIIEQNADLRTACYFALHHCRNKGEPYGAVGGEDNWEADGSSVWTSARTLGWREATPDSIMERVINQVCHVMRAGHGDLNQRLAARS